MSWPKRPIKTPLLFTRDLALLLLEIWYEKQLEDVDIDWRGTPQDPGQTPDALGRKHSFTISSLLERKLQDTSPLLLFMICAISTVVVASFLRVLAAGGSMLSTTSPYLHQRTPPPLHDTYAAQPHLHVIDRHTIPSSASTLTWAGRRGE